ncbi:hypothetical protein R8Z57_07905 [Microbacterium sp. M3]|uniref:Uncharacterized protein n=1 Tax=Microbacterium arthrosphaerae TaxID=792652 RepID=A0ABU4H059_9MICO|nr:MULTISPECIES: hypothetical protein [Microbacterium]MDW4572697.1 hypothetical protein [Microbacterium arthrosphaerae]MDW7606552.1 hypothetical protein [Microbacterium sp. M3]
MRDRSKSAPVVPVHGDVPAPAPIYRSVPLLVALALFAASVAWTVVLVLLGVEPAMLPIDLPAPWLFLYLAPSVAAILLALRGLTVWALAATVLSLGLVVTGVATAVVVVVALLTVRGIRRQWAAHDLDTVLTTAAARDLPVLAVQHVAGEAKKRKTAQTTQLQVRDVDTGELATARVWGRVRVGTLLVRQGMNIIAQAPPGAEDELRRWVERENRRR